MADNDIITLYFGETATITMKGEDQRGDKICLDPLPRWTQLNTENVRPFGAEIVDIEFVESEEETGITVTITANGNGVGAVDVIALQEPPEVVDPDKFTETIVFGSKAVRQTYTIFVEVIGERDVIILDPEVEKPLELDCPGQS